jgi:hypothetical protein
MKTPSRTSAPVWRGVFDVPFNEPLVFQPLQCLVESPARNAPAGAPIEFSEHLKRERILLKL